MMDTVQNCQTNVPEHTLRMWKLPLGGNYRHAQWSLGTIFTKYTKHKQMLHKHKNRPAQDDNRHIPEMCFKIGEKYIADGWFSQDI